MFEGEQIEAEAGGRLRPTGAPNPCHRETTPLATAGGESPVSNDAESPRRAGVRRVVTTDPALRVEYDRCGACEQTSLRGPAAIEHAPGCPHARDRPDGREGSDRA